MINIYVIYFCYMFRDNCLEPHSYFSSHFGILLGIEVFKRHLWDFSELGNSFEKSGDIFEILEVNWDSGKDYSVFDFGSSGHVTRDGFATCHLGILGIFLWTNGGLTPSTLVDQLGLDTCPFIK